MNRQIPFVQRTSRLCPREGYSTAQFARYDGWAGLYDEHGQHTIVLKNINKHTLNCPSGICCALTSHYAREGWANIASNTTSQCKAPAVLIEYD